MVLKKKLNVFIIFISFMCFIIGANAVVLTPGVDADITYGDTSNGIIWSTFSIYAKTGISVGDIIEIPYDGSNSTDYGLYPSILKIKDEDIIICVNELLDNVAPFTAYPICFYNNNNNITSEGFNYSIKEAQGLFTTKEYDIVWGKRSDYFDYSNYFINSSNFIYNNVSFNGTDYILEYEYNYSSSITKDACIVNELNSFDFNPTTYSQCTVSSSAITPKPFGKFFSEHYVKEVYTRFLFDMNDGAYSGGNRVILESYDGNDWNPEVTLMNIGSLNGEWYSGTTQLNKNIQGLRLVSYHTGNENYYIRYYDFDINWGYKNNGYIIQNNSFSLLEDFNAYEIDYEDINYNNGILFSLNTSNGEFNFTNDELDKVLNNGNDIAVKLYLESSDSIGTPKVKEVINLKIGNKKLQVDKESDDAINGVNLVPFQTNSAWASFLTIDMTNGTNLWYDLNDFDSAVLTNNLDSYLVDGTNIINVTQVNNDGGFWMFFEGQYNTAPTLSPTPTLNTTEDLELGQSIYCNAGTYQDSESDPQSGIEFGWWKNNVQQAPSTQALNIATISAVKGDLIKCGERVNDGSSWSSWYYTTELTVIGAKPTANLTLNPISPGQGENVTCIISDMTDADGDNITAVLKWIEEGTTVLATSGTINMTGGNLTLDSSLINSSNGYECVATLDDTTAEINISKSFGVGNIAPTMIRTLDLDTSYKYDDYVYSDIGCLADDVNGDTITYTYEYSYDKINWTIAKTTTSGKFEWDTSNLAAGDYFLRCKADDTILSTSYSELPSNISIVKYAKSVQTNTDNFYSIRLTVSSGASVLEDQYDSGSTGYLAGDLGTNYPTKIITYLPDKFDGNRKFTSFEINPNLVYIGGDSEAIGTVKNYDILVYQVDNIGEIPTGTPLVAYYDTNFNIGVRNAFVFDIIPSKDKYIAVKVCKNVNELTNECKSDGNSLTDSIIVRGEGTGTYLAKVDQGTGSYTSVSNLDVKFEWDRDPLDKVKTLVELNYPDDMVPFVVLKRGSQEHICGNKDVALKEGIPECIESVSGSNYFINTENLESNVVYDVVGGAELVFTEAGSKTLSVNKNTAMSASVRMTLLGAEYDSSFTSSPQLIFNSNNFWSVGGEFSAKVSSNPLNTVLLDGENSLQFSSSAPGKIIFWMEPIYSNLNVVHGTVMSPVENAQTELDVSFTTDLDVNIINSYCGLTKAGLLVSRVSIAGTDGGYGCVPYLTSTDEAGSYVLVVHVDDGTGYVDEYQSSISYSELKALSINTIDFEEVEYLSLIDNRTLKASTTISNSGNVEIGMVKIKARLDKFWDDDGVNSFEYEDNLFFADLITRLDSDKYRKEFLMTEENDMFFDFTELGPGDEIPVHFQVSIPQGVPIDEYTTEWEVLYE